MSGKYVPPSRREGYTPKTTDTLPWIKPPKSSLNGTKDGFMILESIFQTPQQGTYNYFLYHDPPSPYRIPYDPTRTAENTPLPPTAPSHPLGHLISYIMIFPRAHPLWESGGELWHHTASGTLAGDWKGEKRNFGRPIPVFTTATTGARGKVQYLGWWTLNALREVEPRSEEVIDLLESKEAFRTYGRGGRTREAWADALEDKWVKTRLTPVEESHPMYEQLVDPMTLGEGEGGRLVLRVGGMEGEIKILDASQEPGGMPSDRESGGL